MLSFTSGSNAAVTLSARKSITFSSYLTSSASKALIIAPLIFSISNGTIFPSLFLTL